MRSSSAAYSASAATGGLTLLLVSSCLAASGRPAPQKRYSLSMVTSLLPGVVHTLSNRLPSAMAGSCSTQPVSAHSAIAAQLLLHCSAERFLWPHTGACLRWQHLLAILPLLHPRGKGNNHGWPSQAVQPQRRAPTVEIEVDIAARGEQGTLDANAGKGALAAGVAVAHRRPSHADLRAWHLTPSAPMQRPTCPFQHLSPCRCTSDRKPDRGPCRRGCGERSSAKLPYERSMPSDCRTKEAQDALPSAPTTVQCGHTGHGAEGIAQYPGSMPSSCALGSLCGLQPCPPTQCAHRSAAQQDARGKLPAQCGHTCMVTSAWRPTGPTARLTPPLRPQCRAPANADTAALRAHKPLSAISGEARLAVGLKSTQLGWLTCSSLQ